MNLNKDKKIVIIGAGWYGLHIASFINENYDNYNISILEKTNDFFDNSSNYNQNRLHLGYHYPRSGKTRNLCKDGYDKFISKYREVIDFIDNNFYLISKDSIIDYETFVKIYSNENKYDHTIINNTKFTNIDGNIINTKEKIINSEKVKNYFKSTKIYNLIKFNYEVKNITKNENKVIINNEIECDILINCTYNQLSISNYQYIYELTISLIYERIDTSYDFESITVMDGNFFSIFPREIGKRFYTLTHVKYTPLIKSKNINDIFNYELTTDKVNEICINMENDVVKYYSLFKKHFTYKKYFTSYKCKLITNNDTRECNISNDDNIISVNCGKITGIFEFEDYIKNIL